LTNIAVDHAVFYVSAHLMMTYRVAGATGETAWLHQISTYRAIS
jgi:hypothetical protein